MQFFDLSNNGVMKKYIESYCLFVCESISTLITSVGGAGGDPIISSLSETCSILSCILILAPVHFQKYELIEESTDLENYRSHSQSPSWHTQLPYATTVHVSLLQSPLYNTGASFGAMLQKYFSIPRYMLVWRIGAKRSKLTISKVLLHILVRDPKWLHCVA